MLRGNNKKQNKVNFLTWTGLRHSIPSNRYLKTVQYRFTKDNPFMYKNNIFDIL